MRSEWWTYIYSHPCTALYPQGSNLTEATDALSNLAQLPLETKLTGLVIFIMALHTRMLSCCLYDDTVRRTNLAPDLCRFPNIDRSTLATHPWTTRLLYLPHAWMSVEFLAICSLLSSAKLTELKKTETN